MFKIGLDLGYGYTKGVNEAGRRVAFPSLVGAAYDRKLGSIFARKAHEDVIENMHVVISDGRNGQEYFVGELARREGKNTSYAFDEDKINHPNTRALLAAASFLLFPEEEVPVHIVSGLPLEQYVHQKNEFRGMLEGFKAVVGVKGSDRTRVVKFQRATPFLQAAGAVYYAIMDELNRYLVEGAYIGLVDIGFRTTDYIVFVVSKGRLVLREDLSGTLDMGMSALNNAVDKLFTQRTGTRLDIAELMHLVESGSIYYRGEKIEFGREVDAVRSEVARVLKDRVKVVWGNKLDFFHTIFLAGGGAKQLKGHMNDLYSNVVTVKNAQMANALGFLKVAELEEKR
ncbi:MAG: ParM/StbA family protein [Bacillota bacterium]|nr:ParM/StbA family protein [Bacillota bacterium]NPV44840.1 ParM/StbA family protein [Bacillota bacterium]